MRSPRDVDLGDLALPIVQHRIAGGKAEISRVLGIGRGANAISAERDGLGRLQHVSESGPLRPKAGRTETVCMESFDPRGFLRPSLRPSWQGPALLRRVLCRDAYHRFPACMCDDNAEGVRVPESGPAIAQDFTNTAIAPSRTTSALLRFCADCRERIRRSGCGKSTAAIDPSALRFGRKRPERRLIQRPIAVCDRSQISWLKAPISG